MCVQLALGMFFKDPEIKARMEISAHLARSAQGELSPRNAALSSPRSCLFSSGRGAEALVIVPMPLPELL